MNYSIQIVNPLVLIEQDLLRRGYVLKELGIKLPESIEVICEAAKPFEVTHELIWFAYPAEVILKSDLELVKEKIRESFFELLPKEQEILIEFFDERLPANEKNKKSKELKGISPQKHREFKSRNKLLKQQAMSIRKKLKKVFVGKYRLKGADLSFEEVKKLKREDFLVLKESIFKNSSLDDKHKELPWQHIIELDVVQYPHWTIDNKMDAYRHHFKTWL